VQVAAPKGVFLLYNLNTRFGAAPPMLFVNTGLIEFQAISRHGLRKDIKTEENREENKRKGRL